MSWFDRLRNHSRDDDVARDIDREMAFHLAERTDDLVGRGMQPDAARREARRRFGNLGLQKERTRERDLFASLDILLRDLRYAVRALRLSPVFTIVAALSLALGIGANTAIFSILNAVMLKSLPVDHPEELVAVVRSGGTELTNPIWEAIRDQQDMFTGAFASADAAFSLAESGEARRIDAQWVSGAFFSTLGVQPAVGRLLTTADDYRGCPATVVLNYDFWQSEYGGERAVVGKSIRFDGHPFTIVGVSAPRFFGAKVGRRPQAFVPLCSQAVTDGPNALDARSRWYLQVMARPKPGLSLQAIDARFAALTPGIAEAAMPTNWPPELIDGFRKATYTVVSSATGFSDLRLQYRTALVELMVVVGLVLLVACANIANLLLARGTTRRREIAVRLALGAGRGRIARQLVTESLLLAFIGAALGALFAAWGSRLLVAMLSESGQAIALDLAPDGRMLAFTTGVAVLAALLFGVVPAWQVSRVDPQAVLKAQGRGVSEARGRLAMGRALVSFQIALSLVLITAAALLVGSWRRLATLDPGFRREQVLLLSADLRGAKLSPDERDASVNRLLSRFRALPGVRAAATVAVTPVSGSGWNNAVSVNGARVVLKRDAMSWFNAVSEDYFKALGIPVLAGRDFDTRDTPTSPPVAIVSQSMAQKFFGTPNAVGRTFQTMEGREMDAPVTVIGVVGNTKYRSLRDSLTPVVYLPRAQGARGDERVNFVLFVEAPDAAMPTVRQAVAETAPRATITMNTLERQLDRSMPVMRATATVSGFFGGLALVLATIGLYGLMSYSVARRRNEIGVRIALGAERGRVVRMVLSDVSRVVATGIVIGVGLSFAATKLVASFIYDVRRNDPATLSGSALVLFAIGAAAAAWPAWRAASIDPVSALREE